MSKVTKAHWQDDKQQSKCNELACHTEFSLTERKKHCAKCGLIFCSTHCSATLQLDESAHAVADRGDCGVKSKVCDLCALEFRFGVVDESGEPLVRQARCQELRTRILRLYGELRRPTIRNYSTGSLLLPWIECFCIVKFHLHVGQQIELSVPEQRFSDVQEREISSLAFPDSNVFEESRTQYTFIYNLNETFRKRRQTIIDSSGEGNENSPTFEERGGELFGYVYYRQRKDPSLPRGAFQKALILFSAYPFVGLFQKIQEILGAKFFDQLEFSETEAHGILQEAVETASLWPVPTPDTEYDLSLLGETIGFKTPLYAPPERSIWSVAKLAEPPAEFQATSPRPSDDGGRRSVGHSESSVRSDDDQLSLPVDSPRPAGDIPVDEGTLTYRRRTKTKTKSRSSSRVILDFSSRRNTLSEINLHCVFYSQLIYLWKLWEVIIAGEPLCILSTCPTTCSQAVLACASLIAPLPYCGLVRPFFTVSSPEFTGICKLKNVDNISIIIGTTNPYFARALEHWPHFLTIAPSRADTKPCQVQRAVTNNKGRGEILENFSEKFFSDRSFCVKSDKGLLREVLKCHPNAGNAFYQGSAIQAPDGVLRKHFETLTYTFLAPVQKCIATLWVLRRCHLLSDTEWSSVFTREAILESLEHANFPKGMLKKDRDVKGLYKRFLNSTNFDHYLTRCLEGLRRIHIMEAETADQLVTGFEKECSIDRVVFMLEELLEKEKNCSLVDTQFSAKLQMLVSRA